MNISVPGDLKRDMDAVAAAVNWSAVAAEAFRAKLLELRATQKGSSMNDVIERMKAAAKLDASESYQDGKAAGTQWAKTQSRPRELKRIEKAIDEYRGDVGEWVGIANNGSNRGIAVDLVEAITGDTSFNHSDVREFWDNLIGEPADRFDEEDDFARGFIEGAMEVWEAVKDHI
jgi:hypothetical protein